MNTNKSMNDSGINNSTNYKSRNDTAKTFVYASKNEISIQSEHKTENNLKQKTKTKQKPAEISKLITTFATMISAAVVGVVGVGSIIPTSKIKAEIQEIYAYESGVSYYISLQEYNGEDDVYVVLYNDFTNRSQKVEEPEFQGNFENLQTNMVYTLAVKQGSKVIVSKKIRTINEDQTNYYDDSGGDQTDPTTGDNQNDTGTNNSQNDNPTGENTNG